MKALSYLYLTYLKNTIKNFFKNKGKVFLMVFLVAVLGLVIWAGGIEPKEAGTFRSRQELNAIVYALLLATFLLSVFSGLSSGGSFYRMPDVNFLFPSPIEPRKILFYGLIKQAGSSLMVGFFLLFQYTWLSNTYGMTLLELVFILLCYGISMFAASLTAVFLYAFSSRKEGRRTRIKIGIYVLLAVIAAYLVLPGIGQPLQDLLAGVVARATSLPILAVPPVGWMTAAVIAFSAGETMTVLFWMLLTAFYIALVVVLMMRTTSDFYEDVLAATERGHTAIVAAQQGKTVEALPTNVKVGKTGLKKGRGASAFFYKHLLEHRRGRFFFLDTMSFVCIGVTVGFSMIFAMEGGMQGDENAMAQVYSLFFMSVYMMIFTMGTGRWAKELMLPYVYLAPTNPFSKLVAVCGEWVLKLLLESAILFALAVPLCGISIPVAFFCLLARMGFGLLYMAGNLLCQRLLGGLMNKVLIGILYVVILLVLSIPSIVLGVLLSAVFQAIDPIIVMMSVLFIGNVCIAIVLAFLSRNILETAELNDR